MTVTRSPVRKDGNTGITDQVNLLVAGKECESLTIAGYNADIEGEYGDVMEVFTSSLGKICREVEQMGTWLSKNPRSRTGLREFVERSNKELRNL